MNSKQKIRAIFTEALNTVRPENFIRRTVLTAGDNLSVAGAVYPFSPERGIHVFGSGKASVNAARAVEDLLAERIAGGLVVSNHDDGSLERIKVHVSSHPIPDGRSIEAADLLMDGLSALSGEDFFIYLLSGGTSALVEKPMPPLTLDDLQETSRLLLEGGLSIGEVNVVRKHLSLVKGGRLGRMTEARGVALVVSDVIGDDLEAIGSAPLYCDRSSFRDASSLLNRYGLWESLPHQVRSLIGKGLAGDIDDTPKEPNPAIDHIMVGNNITALQKAGETAAAMGYAAHIMTSRLRGEARETAKALVSLGEEILTTQNPFGLPVCLLFGGETTVTVRGKGKGGRNQEMCLAALREIGNREGIQFLSAGTDGLDGNSHAAGAAVDCRSYRRAAELGLNIDSYLANNDSQGFLEQTGDLIITGPTGTNVMDITIMLMEKGEL